MHDCKRTARYSDRIAESSGFPFILRIIPRSPSTEKSHSVDAGITTYLAKITITKGKISDRLGKKSLRKRARYPSRPAELAATGDDDDDEDDDDDDDERA